MATHNIFLTPSQHSTLPDGYVIVAMDVQPDEIIDGVPTTETLPSQWHGISHFTDIKPPFSPGDELVLEQKIVCCIKPVSTKIAQYKRTVTATTLVETDGVWEFRVEFERKEKE